VNVLCLMAGIVIICKSDSKTTLSADTLMAAKAKLLFDVFDFNQKGYISRDETSILLLSVSQIMRIITVQTSTVAATVDAAELDAMADELFTQGAFKNGEMTCEQFVSIAVQYMTHANGMDHSIMLDKLGLISNTTAAASDSHEYATAHTEPQVTTESAMETPVNDVTVETGVVDSPTANDNSIDTAECDSKAMPTDNDVQAQSFIADTSEHTNINTMNNDIAAAVTANKNDADTVRSVSVDAAAVVNVESDVIASVQEVTSVSAHVNDDKLLASPVSHHGDLAINEPLHTGATTVSSSNGSSTDTETAPVPWWLAVASQTVTPSTVTADSTSNSTAIVDIDAISEQHCVTQPLITTSANSVVTVAAATATAAAAVEPVLSENHSDVATIAHDDLHVSKSKSAKNTPVLQRADSELQQEASGVILLADETAYNVQHKPQLLLLTAAADTIIDSTEAIAVIAIATTAPAEHVANTTIDATPPVTIVNDDSRAITFNTSGVEHAVEKITPNDDTSKPVPDNDAVKATVALQQTATVTGSVLANSDNDTSKRHDDDSTIQPVMTVCNEQSDDVTPVLTAAATATVGTSAAQTRLLQRAESELQQEATGVILLSDKASYKEEQKPQILLLTA
jgi:hypothetical protein